MNGAISFSEMFGDFFSLKPDFTGVRCDQMIDQFTCRGFTTSGLSYQRESLAWINIKDTSFTAWTNFFLLNIPPFAWNVFFIFFTDNNGSLTGYASFPVLLSRWHLHFLVLLR